MPEAQKPLVSVVVPTYNRRALLQETIASILAQGYRSLEVVVVDNCSQDGTEDYVRGIGDTRVRYARNANGGVIAVNRNLGLSLARGEYVAFCDDDDLWRPDKLAKQVAAMEADRSYGLCYTNAAVFDGREVVSEWMVRRRFFRGHFERMLRGNLVPNSSMLIRRRALDTVGVLDTDPALRGAEDYEFTLRIASSFPFCYLDEMLILYRVHGANLSTSRAEQARRDVLVLKSVRRKLGLRGPLISWFLFFHRVRFLIHTLCRR